MKVGFIGLGIMGKPMAKNLIKAGHELVVMNRSQAPVEELVELGACPARTAAEVAEKSEVIITMLPNSPQVREVALGSGGIIEGATPGCVLIDMSSIDPTETRSIGSVLAENGIEMIDAPVSGGEPKAIDGTLSVMVGGKLELVNQYRPLLMSMAGSVTYIGELGSGNVCKLANQMIVVLNIASLAEALTFSKAAGANPQLVFEAIRGGLAGSTVMDAKAPMMLRGNFNPGFRIALHAKDLTNALNAAHDLHASAPLTAQAMEMMQACIAFGGESDDHSGLLKHYERITGIKL